LINGEKHGNLCNAIEKIENADWEKSFSVNRHQSICLKIYNLAVRRQASAWKIEKKFFRIKAFSSAYNRGATFLIAEKKLDESFRCSRFAWCCPLLNIFRRLLRILYRGKKNCKPTVLSFRFAEIKANREGDDGWRNWKAKMQSAI